MLPPSLAHRGRNVPEPDQVVYRAYSEQHNAVSEMNEAITAAETACATGAIQLPGHGMSVMQTLFRSWLLTLPVAA